MLNAAEMLNYQRDNSKDWHAAMSLQNRDVVSRPIGLSKDL